MHNAIGEAREGAAWAGSQSGRGAGGAGPHAEEARAGQAEEREEC